MITNHLPPLKHRISLRELDTEAMKPAEIFPLSRAERKVKSLRELSGYKSEEGGGACICTFFVTVPAEYAASRHNTVLMCTLLVKANCQKDDIS